jgi:hypothetical protein
MGGGETMEFFGTLDGMKNEERNLLRLLSLS